MRERSPRESLYACSKDEALRSLDAPDTGELQPVLRPRDAWRLVGLARGEGHQSGVDLRRFGRRGRTREAPAPRISGATTVKPKGGSWRSSRTRLALRWDHGLPACRLHPSAAGKGPPITKCSTVARDQSGSRVTALFCWSCRNTSSTRTGWGLTQGRSNSGLGVRVRPRRHCVRLPQRKDRTRPATVTIEET